MSHQNGKPAPGEGGLPNVLSSATAGRSSEIATPRQVTRAEFSWRDVLKIHPAAELFPLLPEDELQALADDIKANGLRTGIVLWAPDPNSILKGRRLIDGRNRLDALSRLGILCADKAGMPATTKKWTPEGWVDSGDPIQVSWSIYLKEDPYALALSYNIHRRHLNAEQQRNLIDALLKATPEKSDRQIAKQVKDDHKKVGRQRSKMESTGAIAPVENGVGEDGKGRKLPKKATRQEPDDDDDDDDIEANIYPENYRTAYMLRADQARQFASYLGPIDKDIVDMAEQVAKAWSELAQQLERKRWERSR